MKARLNPSRRLAPLVFGVAALLSATWLLACDAFPQLLPADQRGLLGAIPLTLIALAYLLYENVRRPSFGEVVKATLLALAFLFWAGNQYWGASRWAALLNDVAIGLFVLDIFFVMVGWPANSPDEAFGEIYTKLDKE
jgi:hypothetical protein